MPTAHRKAMVAAGYAPKHHGRDKAAEKLVAAQEKENQKRLAEAAGPNADEVAAEKRAARRKGRKAAEKPARRKGRK